MNDIIETLEAFENELDKNKLIEKQKFQITKTPANASLTKTQRELGMTEPSVLDFYEAANGVEIKWRALDKAMIDNEMTGSVKINSFLEVVKDWDGVVFFGNEPKDSPLLEFFPLDFFADEGTVGFCTKEGWRNAMYLYKFDNELIPLYLNFDSYLKCLLNAKGVYYWQYLILEILENEETPVSERIKKYLPQLFPDFSFTEFKNLFNRLRLK